MKIINQLSGLLLAAAIFTMSCGGAKDGKTGDAKKEAEAPKVALKPLDLSKEGFPFTIQAPEGAVISKGTSSTEIVVEKDRFSISVNKDEYGEEAATAIQAKEAALEQDTKMNNDETMGLKMEVLKNDPAGYMFMVTNKMGGKVVRFNYYIEKDKKKYYIRENFLKLNDIEKSMETGYAISREETELMYNAVKQ
jgi:hypothetical protein